jgi:hypothetical protein
MRRAASVASRRPGAQWGAVAARRRGDRRSEPMRLAIAAAVHGLARHAAPFVLGLSLSGCVFVRSESYPAGWPALQPASRDCASIAGVYADAGERAGSGAPARDSLSSALGHFKPDAIDVRTDRVAISFIAGDTMDVRLLEGSRSVGAFRFASAAGEYRCGWGTITISRSKFTVADQAHGIETETIEILKAADASLILQRSTSIVGATGGIIPLVVSVVESWSRFAPSPQE